MNSPTCLCRPMAPNGPDSVRIGQIDHCPIHGNPQPEFSVMLYGQRYDFYTVESFSRVIGRSVSNLNKDTKNPARVKDRGRVLWCKELYVQNLFPKGHVFETAGGVPVTGRRLTVKDFEGYVTGSYGGTE